VVGVLVAAVWACPGTSPASAAETLVPARVTMPPVIDGDLSDAAWEQVPHVTGFKTWRPDFGLLMADQTIVYYTYDSENMYFAFRAFDREPGRIKASVTSRDNIVTDDWICINLDSFNDQQALYALYVNPLGIQGDSRYAAGREDYGFDAVWYSAGRLDDQGYTVEVRVPFKSLRYASGDPVRMGVVFERHVGYRSEGGTYPPLSPSAGTNFLIQTIPIEFAKIKHYTLLEVLPDATYSQQDAAGEGRLARTSSGGDFGVTAKYGLTSQLVVDAAVNPDFSQVEADAGQIDVNLRYALFFPEKRPFFLEGQDVFNFAASTYGLLDAVVHTRNIGNPLVGVKVSGKLSALNTISSLYAADELPPSDGGAGDRYAHVAILRYKRTLSQDSYVGGFYTGREEGSGFNRVAGGDASLRLDQSSALGFHAFGSSTRDAGEADAVSGYALGADYTRNTRNLSLYTAAFDISPRFETRSGFLTRSGVLNAKAFVTPKLYPTGSVIQRVEPRIVIDHLRDTESGLWEGWNEAGVGLVFPRSAKLVVKYHWSSEVYRAQEFPTSGLDVQAAAQFTRWLRISASVGRSRAIYYSESPLSGRTTRGSLSVVFQPSEKWYEGLTLTYANFDPADGGLRLYDYAITRSKTTYQVNRYLFFRAVVEYNSFRRQLLTDFLGSFTYIPGTVLHVGYGSLYEKLRWEDGAWVPGRDLLETRRGLFFKVSYLWRL